jgi:nucleoside-diphosphate-sugar epimerase
MVVSGILFLFAFLMMADALSSKRVVLVSGAGGQTGQSLFRKLLQAKDEFEPIGLVRSQKSKDVLVASGISESSIAVVDVTDREAVRNLAEQHKVQAFCICTSAKPAPTENINPETGRPDFAFPNGDPQLVDWEGQKNQIDACPKGGHVVVCSTMGGTNANHPLNQLGKTINDDGTSSGGNIVKWKRKSEVYLTEQEHLSYTIVHPGGLVNEPGGERALVVGVDDDMSGSESRTVPREDVAQVMLEALRYPNVYAGRSFDLRAAEKEDGNCVNTNFATLLNDLKGKNCDYSLGEIM